MRPPLRSTPPTSPSPYRYLGRGGGERPVRVQVILALVAALVLVAVPLYLWRRPQPASLPSADAAPAGASPILPPPVMSGRDPADPSPTQLVPSNSSPKVEVAPIKTLKCQNPGSGKTPPERCDGVRFFEDSLARAIRDSASCAPSSKSGYVVSFVLEAHFGKKRTNLFFGKSTTLSKSRRRELLRCVEKALATPEWDRIPHQHQRYSLNAVATYPASVDSSGDESRVEPLAPQKPSKPGDKPKPKTKSAPKQTPKGEKKK